MNPAANSAGRVASVNVGGISTVERHGRRYATAIDKHPVAGAVALRGVNLAGDDQADRNAHGGPDRAVYAYAAEDYGWWERELGRGLAAGAFGENLTTSGIDVTNARIGEEWAAGTAVLAVTSPRIPCCKLAGKLNDPAFVKTFAAALRPGAYMRVVREGMIGAGDPIDVIRRPDHGVTIADVARIYLFARDERQRLLEVPELTDGWREWAVGDVVSM